MDHHAYILINTKPENLPEFAALPELGADIWREEYEMFGVDEAKALRDRQSRHALVGEAKYFFLTIWKISVEAQNALLKTLEEPTAGTKIIIIVPSEEMLLPTVKSRAVVIRQEDNPRELESDAKKFLSLEPIDRIKWIETFLKAEPSKEKIIKLLNGLEGALAQSLNPATAPILERVAVLKSYAADRSPSLRLLLENAAFIIPKI